MKITPFRIVFSKNNIYLKAKNIFCYSSNLGFVQFLLTEIKASTLRQCHHLNSNEEIPYPETPSLLGKEPSYPYCGCF